MKTRRTPATTSLVFQLAIVLGFAVNSAYGAPAAPWLLSQTNTDASLASGSDIATAYQATAEALITLHTLGETTTPAYLNAVQYINANNIHTTESLSRKILVDVVAGVDFHAFGPQASRDP